MSWLAHYVGLLLFTLDIFRSIPIENAQASLTLALLALTLILLFGAYFDNHRTEGTWIKAETSHNWLSIMLASFLGYVAVRLVLAPSLAGLQNFTVWTLFFASYFAGRRRRIPADLDWRKFGRTVLVWGAATAAFYLVQRTAVWALFGEGYLVYSNRAVGWGLVVSLCVGIGLLGGKAKWRDWVLITFVLAVIVLSLSRSATLAALLVVMIGLFQMIRRADLKLLPQTMTILAAGLLTLPLFILLTQFFPQFGERFAGGDGVELQSGIQINTSGRAAIWNVTLDRWADAPAIGNGPGDIQGVLMSTYGGQIDHPHNEYLRMLSDFGVVGAILFFSGLIAVLAAGFKVTSRSPVHFASSLTLLSLLIGSLTDNLTVYFFVMTPIGVIVGLAGASSAPMRSARSLGRS